MYFSRLLIEMEHLWPAGEWCQVLTDPHGGSPGRTWRGLCSPVGRSLCTALAGLPSPDHICPIHSTHLAKRRSHGAGVTATHCHRLSLGETCFCGAVCGQEGAPCGAAEPQHCPAVSPCCVLTVSHRLNACPGGGVQGEHWLWEVTFCDLMKFFFICLVQDH